MKEKELNEKKEKLLSFIPDLLTDFFYYDRKECEEVTADEVNEMLESNILTCDEVLKAFNDAIFEYFTEE